MSERITTRNVCGRTKLKWGDVKCRQKWILIFNRRNGAWLSNYKMTALRNETSHGRWDDRFKHSTPFYSTPFYLALLHFICFRADILLNYIRFYHTYTHVWCPFFYTHYLFTYFFTYWYIWTNRNHWQTRLERVFSRPLYYYYRSMREWRWTKTCQRKRERERGGALVIIKIRITDSWNP